MNFLTLFLIAIRCFALLTSLIAMAFILLGPGVCYIDNEVNDLTVCNSETNFNFFEWKHISWTVYLHIPIIGITLSAVSSPIYSLFYHFLTNTWEDKNIQIAKLFKGSMIFLVCGVAEIYLLVTINIQSKVHNYEVKSFIQGWASAAGIYFSNCILQLIDMFIIYIKFEKPIKGAVI
uniref:7TM_GPCR_Srx domain-containing protein n=1 Tax=Strongyloides papillosus TaxID=174720 RepID=A0A0N5BSF5_STREA